MPLSRRRRSEARDGDDPLVPILNARILRRLLPRSTLQVVRGGHLGLLTSADELAPVIEDFREQAGDRIAEPPRP